MSERNERDREQAWQMSISMLGINGVLWALIKVLLRRGIITDVDLEEQFQGDAGRRIAR